MLPGWARFEFELSDSEGDYSGEGSIHTNSDDDSDTIAAAHSVSELREHHLPIRHGRARRCGD